MEESEEILMRSLKNLGIEIPSNINSIKDIDSSSFFSISSQSLQLLSQNTNTSSFSTLLPDSMAEKVKSCTDMAAFLQDLGYPFEISFRQFLYPSKEDLCKIVRFFVERLSELSEARKTLNYVDDVKPKTLESDSDKVPSLEISLRDEKLDDAATTGRVVEQEPETSAEDLRKKKAAQLEETAVTEISMGEQESISCEGLSPELRCKVEGSSSQETVFPEMITVDLELHQLEEEHELFKEAMKLAIDDEHYAEKLSEQIATRKQNFQELESQCEVNKKSLEEKRWNLLEAFCAKKPDCHLKLKKLKEIDQEMHSVLSNIGKREEECANLAVDLEKQPKVASRKSYIERITEITKNSRKLDTDIERILKDTRELKIESNSIEERLHRTYAVVDEKIFREAKKDPVGRQAYKMVTNIHESFEKIREQVLEADKVKREVAELEVKLSAIASQSLDKDKLQADLDAMRRENEYLEKTLLGH